MMDRHITTLKITREVFTAAVMAAYVFMHAYEYLASFTIGCAFGMFVTRDRT